MRSPRVVIIEGGGSKLPAAQTEEPTEQLQDLKDPNIFAATYLVSMLNEPYGTRFGARGDLLRRTVRDMLHSGGDLHGV